MRTFLSYCCLTFLGTGMVLGQNPTSDCKREGGLGRDEQRLAVLREIVSSSDTDATQTRAMIKVDRAPAAVVTLLDDTEVCRRAAEALNQLRAEPSRTRQLWVFDLGTGYAVEDLSSGISDVDYSDRFVTFFDRDWQYVVTMSGF